MMSELPTAIYSAFDFTLSGYLPSEVYFAFFFIDIGRKKEQVPTKKTLFLTFRTKVIAGTGLEPVTSDNDSEKFPITPSRVNIAYVLRCIGYTEL